MADRGFGFWVWFGAFLVGLAVTLGAVQISNSIDRLAVSPGMTRCADD